MVMKPEVKDRVMSHEQPVSAAIYNSKFNQVGKDPKSKCGRREPALDIYNTKYAAKKL